MTRIFLRHGVADCKMMILTPSEKPWVLLPSPFFNLSTIPMM